MEESNLMRVESKIDALTKIVSSIQEKIMNDSLEFSDWEVVDETSLNEEDLKLLEESRKEEREGRLISLEELETKLCI
jgi:hypothetical protein